GGETRFITRLAPGEVTHRWPTFLPGGAVLYTAHVRGINFDDAVIKGIHPKTVQQRSIIQNGYLPRYVRTGNLLYVYENALFAAPFDPAALELRGTPVPVLESVGVPLTGGGQYDVSADGTLVYLPSQDQRTLWTIDALGSSGRTER